MRDVVLLAIHLLVTLAKFPRPGGLRAVAAESLALKHQLPICNRCRQRGPNLTTLDRFHRWLANLRVLEVDEIKTVPPVPVSHPFVERLIGTIRRELIDRSFFWDALDLERKLQEFRGYYNDSRVHQSLGGSIPTEQAGKPRQTCAALDSFGWREHCRRLFQTPTAA